MGEPLRILSIDGGGIRGIIPAKVLAALEDRAKRPTAELFDLIAGTSTGGIIALGLTTPGENGAPRWRADDLVELYLTEGPKIFSRSLFDRIRSADGTLDERYPSSGIDEALAKYFGEARLRDALADVDVLVTSYETVLRQPFFFRSARAREDPAYDYPTRLAARATSAAPTYFEAARVRNDASGDAYSLIDGGMFANNPAMCALAEALTTAPGREVLMVSLGTGQQTSELPWKRIKDWGLLEWAQPLLNVIFDGVSDATDYQVQQVLGERDYLRLQVKLRSASDHLDDAREQNLDAIVREANDLIAVHAAQLDAVVERLVD